MAANEQGATGATGGATGATGSTGTTGPVAPRAQPRWVVDAISHIEEQPTIGKALSVLFEAIATEAKGNPTASVLGEILQNGNALTAAVIKNTSARHEPIA